jgi:DNA polymerase-2
VLGAAACRFFDPQIANAITGFGQQTLRWTAEAFREAGVRVLYGDTDSVFVQAPRQDVDVLRRQVEGSVSERIRSGYHVEPRLELELERYFDRLWLPRVRGGGAASRKRYAGWSDGRLVIVGLEAVRRDWPSIAKRLQRGMLERLFCDRPVVPFVRELAERVLAGEADAELVFVKRIRKASLERYTATTPPHVQAARKLQAAGHPVGAVVRYVVTAAGPEPVIPGRPLPADVDRLHYLEHVLQPLAQAILDEIGERFDEAIGRPKARQLEMW